LNVVAGIDGCDITVLEIAGVVRGNAGMVALGN